jgi:DNA repair/transcription protein MET18/MMS19
MSAEEREDFAAIDSFFKSLYVDVYRNTVQLGSKTDASYDDIKVASQAVQGAGALVCQRPAKSSDLSSNGASTTSERLLPEETCSEICESLFAILKKSCPGHPRSPGGDELINDTAKALQRAVLLFPHGFNGLVDESMNIIRSSRQNSEAAEASETVTTLGGLIGFIGSSELPSSPRSGFDHFYYSARALLSELFDAIEAKSDSQIWCALIATIQSLARYFNDACMATNPDKNLPLEDESLQKIGATYTDLNQLGNEKQAGSSLEYHSRVSQTASVAEIRNEFLLVTLFICKQLYRRATKVIETHPQTGKQALSLSDDFANVDQASGHQYLHLISTLAGFAIHEFNESQQTSLKAEHFAITLFRDDSVTIPQETPKEQDVLENGSSWNWLVSEAPNVLSLGILQALQPSAVARLVCPSKMNHLEFFRLTRL